MSLKNQLATLVTVAHVLGDFPLLGTSARLLPIMLVRLPKMLVRLLMVLESY
jgi:hypothetical protein